MWEFAARRGHSGWSLYGWRSRSVAVGRRAGRVEPPDRASEIKIFVGERALARVPHGFDAAELERGVLEAVTRSC